MNFDYLQQFILASTSKETLDNPGDIDYSDTEAGNEDTDDDNNDDSIITTSFTSVNSTMPAQTSTTISGGLFAFLIGDFALISALTSSATSMTKQILEALSSAS